MTVLLFCAFEAAVEFCELPVGLQQIAARLRQLEG
jgi:hypothetical protein